MKLSPKTHRQLESFFREYYADEKLYLPQIRLFARRGSGFLTKILKIYGITFGRYIFINPNLIRLQSNSANFISRELLAHEAAHVLQYQREGFFGFFYNYLKGYWKALKRKEKWDLRARTQAYLEIPHEVEARECAARFVEWTKKVKTDN